MQVGDLVWIFCGKKWGSRRGQFGTGPPTGYFQAQVFQAILTGAKLITSQLGSPYWIHISKVPCSGPQLTTSGIMVGVWWSLRWRALDCTKTNQLYLSCRWTTVQYCHYLWPFLSQKVVFWGAYDACTCVGMLTAIVNLPPACKINRLYSWKSVAVTLRLHTG